MPNYIKPEHTERLRSVEMQAEYLSVQFDKLGSKVDDLSEGMNVGFTRVSSELRNFKDTLLNKEFSNMEIKHQAELKAATEKTETSAKVRLMWAGLGGVIVTIALALLRLVMARFYV